MADRPVTERTAVILTSGQRIPEWLAAWCASATLDVQLEQDETCLPAMVVQRRPRAVILDGRGGGAWEDRVLGVCRHLKRDSFSAVVPVAVLVSAARFEEAFAAGADEVIRAGTDDVEASVRVAAMLRRSDRDIDVHPSTRLPGTREIAGELQRRIEKGGMFAVCYADLDHFKEFNDRYSYLRGNAVIQLLARLLHDVVKGLCGDDGFVGHIGGDDFLCCMPADAMPRVCDELIEVFDELIPLQYSDQDRRAGYFFGKDRRGELHRVSLMTLSIGVVTNQQRRFLHAADVSERATEMKTYAKTLPGSVWTLDRRREETAPVGSPTAGGSALRRAPRQSRAGGAQ